MSQQVPQCRERISEARIRLLSKNAFFAVLAMELKIKIIPGIGVQIDGESTVIRAIETMGVTADGQLLISPEHVESLTDNELMGSLVHEVLHCALLLFHRMGDRDLWLSNIVHDYIVNLIATDSDFVLPEGLLDERSRGATYEGLYALFKGEYDLKLVDHRAGVPFDQQGCKVNHPSNIDNDWVNLAHDFVKRIKFKDCEGEGEGEGEGNGNDGRPGWDHPNYNPCMEGNSKTDLPPKNSAKERQLKNKWRQALAGAKQKAILSDGWGSLPSNLRQMVDDLVEPTIDWRNKLSRWMGENGDRDDYTYRRPNRRGGFNGIVLPSLRGVIPTVAILVDTSGSMGGEPILEVMSEIAPLIDDLRCTGLFITCDAEVHGVFETPQDVYTMLENLDGGGGSDFIPGFDKLEELGHKGPTIVATDGYITVPDEEPLGMNVLWLLPKGGEEEYVRPALWGEVLEVN